MSSIFWRSLIQIEEKDGVWSKIKLCFEMQHRALSLCDKRNIPLLSSVDRRFVFSCYLSRLCLINKTFHLAMPSITGQLIRLLFTIFLLLFVSLPLITRLCL